MHLYQKNIKPKNKLGKAFALVFLILGAFSFIVSSSSLPFPTIYQTFGFIFLTVSVYIATAYLLREYIYSVAPNDRENENKAYNFDFIIKENKGNRVIKVCDIVMKDIKRVRVIDQNNKKQVAEERKKMSRYTYNTEFAASKKIEIVADIQDEIISVIVTYDEELLMAISSFIEPELN